MNRLTEYSHGAAYVNCSRYPTLIDGRYLMGAPIDGLAAYEDSGLTPEEVQRLAKAKAEGRLVELEAEPEGDALHKAYMRYMRRAQPPAKKTYLECLTELRSQSGITLNKSLVTDLFFARRRTDNGLDGSV